MKSRLTLIFTTLVILLGAMIWLVQDRSNTAITPVMAMERRVDVQVPSIAEPAMAPALVPEATSTIAPPVAVAPSAAAHKTAPMVHVDPSGDVKYVARSGDTVSQLAVALLGSDSKEHRDIVIAANPSLQSNPDRVLEGQAYTIAVSSVQTDAVGTDQRAEPTVTVKDETPSVKPASDRANSNAVATADGPKLKYTAQSGDTVGALASDLLGGNTKVNRDAIIAGNSSLQQFPNHLITGQSYTIPAPNGLTADPNATQAKAPTSQPDADDIVRFSSGRALRYTALPGDTVSKLAEVLLGSDTRANRDLIIKVNPSLKQDPDHLIAGQTYWISAPTAD